MEYVKFSDFGITKENIQWIDSAEGIERVRSQLLNSKVLGMDSEFTNSFTKFDP